MSFNSNISGLRNYAQGNYSSLTNASNTNDSKEAVSIDARDMTISSSTNNPNLTNQASGNLPPIVNPFARKIHAELNKVQQIADSHPIQETTDDIKEITMIAIPSDDDSDEIKNKGRDSEEKVRADKHQMMSDDSDIGESINLVESSFHYLNTMSDDEANTNKIQNNNNNNFENNEEIKRFLAYRYFRNEPIDLNMFESQWLAFKLLLTKSRNQPFIFSMESFLLNEEPTSYRLHQPYFGMYVQYLVMTDKILGYCPIGEDYEIYHNSNPEDRRSYFSKERLQEIDQAMQARRIPSLQEVAHLVADISLGERILHNIKIELYARLSAKESKGILCIPHVKAAEAGHLLDELVRRGTIAAWNSTFVVPKGWNEDAGETPSISNIYVKFDKSNKFLGGESKKFFSEWRDINVLNGKPSEHQDAEVAFVNFNSILQKEENT